MKNWQLELERARQAAEGSNSLMRIAVRSAHHECIALMCRWCKAGEKPERHGDHWYHFWGVSECAAGPIHQGPTSPRSSPTASPNDSGSRV